MNSSGKKKNFIPERIRGLSVFLGLDLPYFIGGGFWLILSMVVVAIGGIFLSVLFAKLLTKDMFGQYSFLMSILGFVSLAALPGMAQTVTQAAAENNDGFFKKAIITTGKWSTLGSLILVLISAYYFFDNNPNLSTAIFLTAIVFPISAAGNLSNAFLAGKKKFRLASIYGTFAQLVSIGATMIALWKFPSLVTVALFSVWSTAIINVILTILTSRYVANKQRFSSEKKDDEKLLRLGFHLSLSQIFTIAADYLDRFLVPIILGFTNNAIYSFAILIPMQIHAFLKLFTTLGQPKVAEIGSKNIKKGLIIKSIQFEIVVAMIIIFYITAAPTIFKVLYPNYQGQAVMLSQLFSLSLLYFPGNILALLFLKERNVKAIYKINVFYALVTIVSLATLIPIFGLVGAVLAKIIVRFFQLLMQITLFSKAEIKS